jgi:hypothetical protein
MPFFSSNSIKLEIIESNKVYFFGKFTIDFGLLPVSYFFLGGVSVFV